MANTTAIPSPPEALMRWAIIVLAAVLAAAAGLNGAQLLGQPPAEASAGAVQAGPTNAVLEERLKGQQALVTQKLDDLKSSVDSFLAAVTSIARDTSSIEASVREQGFTIAAMRSQIDAGVRTDADQEKRLEQLAAELERLRAEREGR